MTHAESLSPFLPRPAHYFPLDKGHYDTGPALSSFGTDFGNGEADQKVFQFDSHFFEYRQTKLDARHERLSKYYRTHMLPGDALYTAARFLIERLTLEQPEFFTLQSRSNDEIALACSLTGETLVFDRKLHLLDTEHNDNGSPRPDYHDALDALLCQTQEDLAIVCKSAFGRDWLGAIHLCLANHWSAEEKIGLPFQRIHQPVAGMRNDERHAEAIVNAIINKGPYVRFAWGLCTDARLNHHPRASMNNRDTRWCEKRFDPASPSLFMRVERQTLWPFPEQRMALFTIRTYLTDCEQVRQDREQNSQLIACIESMTDEQLVYKRLQRDKDNILAWLLAGETEAPAAASLSRVV